MKPHFERQTYDKRLSFSLKEGAVCALGHGYQYTRTYRDARHLVTIGPQCTYA